jgi:hypothetical protein
VRSRSKRATRVRGALVRCARVLKAALAMTRTLSLPAISAELVPAEDERRLRWRARQSRQASGTHASSVTGESYTVGATTGAVSSARSVQRHRTAPYACRVSPTHARSLLEMCIRARCGQTVRCIVGERGTTAIRGLVAIQSRREMDRSRASPRRQSPQASRRRAQLRQGRSTAGATTATVNSAMGPPKIAGLQCAQAN